MGLNIEAARSYGVGVLKRTFGVDAYQRWQRYVESSDDIPGNYSFKENRRITGVILGAIQVAFPGWMDASSRLITAEQDTNPFIFLGKAAPGMYGEFVTWNYLLAPTLVHNPLEFVAFKAGVNIAWPLVSDLYNVALDKISHFRPPVSATLAV